MNIWAKWVEEDQRFAFGLADNGGYEITRERHRQLLDACSTGKVLRPGEEGEPLVSDTAPSSLEELQDRERIWRSAELSRYEWVATRHRDEQEMGGATALTAQQFAELLQYRQALRDWPSADAFPENGQRPKPPAWLADLTQ
ncbi:phage tail assembly chaperone [Pseudomonas shahriarae]|uniref:Phage tail assembly chaperone n=1 Tax=Pseudomonas shahriarae TaxID=2745512 RepID=A0ABT5NFK9_9PSED|nr:phage tail assembly chaperone [Pseudomonas shahriarae]MDD0986607.1 phage tail assembly chaperone [Pseudomonas shahriarae]MDD1034066.1 phage tail assembly chaperone [Pseudomonas shahriarae]